MIVSLLDWSTKVATVTGQCRESEYQEWTEECSFHYLKSLDTIKGMVEIYILKLKISLKQGWNNTTEFKTDKRSQISNFNRAKLSQDNQKWLQKHFCNKCKCNKWIIMMCKHYNHIIRLTGAQDPARVPRYTSHHLKCQISQKASPWFTEQTIC